MAEDGNFLFLAAALDHELDAIVIAIPVTDLSFDPDWR